MCVDPITAAAMAAVAGGSMLEAAGQNKMASRAMKAREGATLAEVQRQNALRDEAVQTYQEARSDVLPVNDEAARTAAADRRVEQYTADLPTAGSAPTALPGSAPTVIADEFTRRMDQANRKARDESASKARLTAYDDVGLNRGFNVKRAGDDIGMVGNFSRGFGAIFPAQLAAAEQNAYAKGMPWYGTLGQVLKTGGQLGAMYGSSRPAPGPFMGSPRGGYVDTLMSSPSFRGYLRSGSF